MSIQFNGNSDQSLTLASAISALSYPFSIGFMIKRNTVAVSRCLVMLEGSSNTRHLEFMTRTATTAGYHAWRHEQKTPTSTFTDLYDDAGLYDTWERIVYSKVSASELNTYTANGTYSNTDTRDVLGGTGGLELLFFGGKNPSSGAPGFPCYIYDLAVWDGTEIDASDYALLENSYASTIPKTPSYNWRGESDLSATVGGIALEESGVGTSYSISGDNPTLSSYSASSGVAGIILGGG